MIIIKKQFNLFVLLTTWKSVCLETPPMHLKRTQCLKLDSSDHNFDNWANWLPSFHTLSCALNKFDVWCWNLKIIELLCGCFQGNVSETIYVLSQQFWEVFEKSGTAANILMTCVVPPEVLDLPVCSASDICAALMHVTPLFWPFLIFLVLLTTMLKEMYVLFLVSSTARDLVRSHNFNQ